MWSSIEILRDPYTHSSSGGLRITCFCDVDVAVRHPESFSVCLDATTT